jgi:chromosome segregation ATPase
MTNTEYQQLVEFLGRQFTAVDQRFNALERRFDGFERSFGEFRQEVLGHFDALYRRLERLEQEYVAITQALRRIEALLADEQTRRAVLERSVADLKQQVALIQRRLEELEARLRH